MVSPSYYPAFNAAVMEIVQAGNTPTIRCNTCDTNIFCYEGSTKHIWENHLFCKKCGTQTNLQATPPEETPEL